MNILIYSIALTEDQRIFFEMKTCLSRGFGRTMFRRNEGLKNTGIVSAEPRRGQNGRGQNNSLLPAIESGCTVLYLEHVFFDLSYADVGQPTPNIVYFFEVPFRGFRGKTKA